MYNPAVIESLKNNSTEENADFIVAQDVPASPSTFDIQVKDYFKSKGGDMIDFKKLADLNFRTPSLVQMIDRLSLELIEKPLKNNQQLDFATIANQVHQKLLERSLSLPRNMISPQIFEIKAISQVTNSILFTCTIRAANKKIANQIAGLVFIEKYFPVLFNKLLLKDQKVGSSQTSASSNPLVYPICPRVVN